MSVQLQSQSSGMFLAGSEISSITSGFGSSFTYKKRTPNPLIVYSVKVTLWICSVAISNLILQGCIIGVLNTGIKEHDFSLHKSKNAVS